MSTLPTVNEYVNLNEENLSWFYGAKKVKKSDKDRASKSDTNGGETKQTRFSLFEESLGCFKVFWRQRDALTKRNEEGPQSRVFSFEHALSNSGRRRYLVSTVERFWRWYESREDASFYEIIMNDCPSRLYFDLEFYRESNADANESQLISAFNDCVKETLNEVFQIKINPDKAMVVLDASTKTKFSEHVIVHLPGGCLFPSNVSMKKSFIDVLEAKMHDSNRGIVWNRDATKKTTLCDTAVYTMNRNFRLYLSSKLGKNNPLILSKRCRYYQKNLSKVPKKQIFLDSLVIPSYEVKSTNVLETLSLNSGSIERNLHPIVLDIPVDNSSNCNGNFVDYMSGHGATSPFPMLDYHIIAINRFDFLAGCRYCFNVGREHRSNHVYWVVDLERFYCFQKCFDVDCHGISSNYFPLPYFVRASIPSFNGECRTRVFFKAIHSLGSLKVHVTVFAHRATLTYHLLLRLSFLKLSVDVIFSERNA
ncbi:unnamed protein product [Toxocara canis]|uniref:DNA-directed primase/polymerase protein n=1 Tax=Toxocara canis TaxID=6265 RepID=A0A183V2J6_TOXCA|nr:unnamed protein product [Toxocara canis]